MAESQNTLGTFIADLMRRNHHNNVSLAAAAGVSEGGIRNLLKHGLDPKAKDPDPRTLRRVADALGVEALMLCRLAGYISPHQGANSVRAEYLADVFDTLSIEKQVAVMSVLEAMADRPVQREAIQLMREQPGRALAGIDLNYPHLLRVLANGLIAQYQMQHPDDRLRIPVDAAVDGIRWSEIPFAVQQRILALIEHKLSLDYDPTMVDQEWRE